MEKKFIIIDGNSLMNRAFYAIPELTNSKGIHTNAIYGFTNMLYKIIDENKPDYIAVAFDRKAPTFRHIEYTEYKAGRKKMPPELNEQFPIIKEILKAFKIGVYEIDGYEADDIIGTIAKKYEKDMEILIYTGDKDELQLISTNIKVAISKKGITEVELYDEHAMSLKYGITPIQFIDIKGLMGDSSDNIPGVPGIGEKTAIKLISEFKSIEGVIENKESITGKKLKELIDKYYEQALFSKKLATIVTDVPIEINIDNIKINEIDNNKLINIFKELEFKSLIEKVRANNKDSSNEIDQKQYKVIKKDDIEYLVNSIKNKGIMSLVVNVKGTDFNNTDIDGMSISYDGIEAFYIFAEDDLIYLLKEIFEDEKILKICHNAKNVYVSLKKHNIDFKGLCFDTAISSYILNPSESVYNIDEIIYKYMNETIPSEKEIKENLKNDINSFNNYLCIEAIYLYRLKDVLIQKLKDNDLCKLYYDIEQPLIEVLASMEIEGFTVDKDILLKLSFEFGKEIDNLTFDIYKMAGEEFNINSPKQLGVILFDKLKLPIIKKTKTGYSTDAEVLEKLSNQHEIISKILDYRQIMKLKSTYVDGLLNILKDDNKIHSSFNQTITSTGRISSTEPNLQNIPIKIDMGKKIRKVFIPTNDEYLILSADYSQIELRVLAHISNDDNLIEAFYNNIDIHKKTAAEVFNVPLDEVTSIMRSRAKAVNFGIVYGISDFGLSRDLNISRSEAKAYIENYMKKYSKVKMYMDDIIKFAKDNGYVTTILKRRRFIPEINSSNFNVKAFGERLAMNTPIQGSAADIIKLAMNNVYYRLKEKKLKSKLILQVHDELILEVFKNEKDIVMNIVKESMENAIELKVPLKIDINIGSNWFEAK